MHNKGLKLNFNKNNKFRKQNSKKFKNPKPKTDDEIAELQAKYNEIVPGEIKRFWDFPLSKKTLQGLKSNNYKVPTDIQRESIGLALQGKDILGAAVTGSGKTLAFLIPILENLYVKKWSRLDGTGAIIISPTRELAYQIFETLKKIGAAHDFSAGLIIGGKNLKFERKRMDQCNIMICTPGRLLQHMDENPLFNSSNMQILVLDEADRCLDMGFEETMNAILENLPNERQTLLFSATQTKSVKDLARLSLKDPVYVAPHEQQAVTPASLKQNYIVANLEDKIAVLWSFIKNHSKQKLIIFLSTCKQVKYVFEIFCKLRPGISLLALYGTLHQDRRVAIYEDFCRKTSCCLFATDIASRGLDFPIVNWVIQLDCPEDVDQYIHRAGRTARHQAKGESLLVLLPSEEEGMIEALKERKVEINQIFVDPKKIFSPRAKMEAYLAANKELKESAQRALVAYVKSVYLMQNKKIFNVDAIDVDAFALSLGLAFTPRVRFLENLRIKKANKLKNTKNLSNNENALSIEKSKSKSITKSSSGSELSESELNLDESKHILADKIKNEEDSKNRFALRHLVLSDSESEDDFLTIKKTQNNMSELEDSEPLVDVEKSKKERKKGKLVTKAALAKRIVKKKIIPNTKVIYNEEGNQVIDPTKTLQSDIGRQYLEENEGGIDLQKAKQILKEEDKFDKERFRQFLKEKRKEKKIKAKKTKDEETGQDDFGTDSEEDDIDLSWLPDPDKVYNPKVKAVSIERGSHSDDNSSYRSDSDSSETKNIEENVHKPPKKLILQKRKTKYSANQNDDMELQSEITDSEEPNRKKMKKLITKLSLEDAEILALNLLKK